MGNIETINVEDKEFNERSVASIPEMAEPCKAAIAWWMGEESGSTLLVENDLMPLVYKALDNGDEAFLVRFASWLEDVASLKERMTDSIVYACVFETAIHPLLHRRCSSPKAPRRLSYASIFS